REPAARGGGEDPALGRRLARLVRARRSFLAHGPDPFCLRADDALQGHHLRQPRAARARIRQAGGPGGRPRGALTRFRRGYLAAAPPHVPAVPAALPCAREPRRGVADVSILLARRHAERLAPRSLWFARDRRRRLDGHREDTRVEGCQAFAWL